MLHQIKNGRFPKAVFDTFFILKKNKIYNIGQKKYERMLLLFHMEGVRGS